MDRIDRDTAALIADRVRALGDSATAPRTFTPGAEGDRSVWYERTPETVNPPAESLGYQPADEARDVAALLDGYARNSTELDDRDSENGAVLVLDLDAAFRIAATTGREYRQAEEDFILSVISLLTERHLWSPRLFNDTSVFVNGQGDSGTFDAALSVINTLRVTQRLPFGGDVEARWVTRAAQELVNESTNAYTSSSDLVLSADVPLLRGAGQIAREDLIQAERNTVYASRSWERFRRTLLVDIANDYFTLLQARAGIANQQRQLESQIRRQKETTAKVAAGRFEPFQNDLVADAVKQSEAQLANQRESFILQLERFKVRLGLDPRTRIRLGEPTLELLEPSQSPDLAAEAALQYRLDLQNRRDILLDFERAVANAKNGVLPDFDLNGSITVPTDPSDDQGGLGLDQEDTSYSIGATFSLPLDRRIERLSVRRAQIALERARRSYDEFRDNIIINARRAIRSIDLARFQLELAETQIEINERGLEDLSLRDDADPQSVLDRENALLAAKNSRDQALTDLRNAVLEYLETTGQMRVRPDGTFDAPSGMIAEREPSADDLIKDNPAEGITLEEALESE